MNSSDSSISVLLVALYILPRGQHLLSIGLLTFPAVLRVMILQMTFLIHMMFSM